MHLEIFPCAGCSSSAMYPPVNSCVAVAPCPLQFYAGLALAQAMPGPLFNFAAYLGERAGAVM